MAIPHAGAGPCSGTGEHWGTAVDAGVAGVALTGSSSAHTVTRAVVGTALWRHALARFTPIGLWAGVAATSAVGSVGFNVRDEYLAEGRWRSLYDVERQQRLQDLVVIPHFQVVRTGGQEREPELS